MSEESAQIATGPREATRRRRAVLLGFGAAVLILAAGITAASALFSSRATITGQQVTTSTVEILATSTPPINTGDLLPGDSAATTITISNTGAESVSLSIRLPLVTGADVSLTQHLIASIAANGASGPFTHTLSTWQTGALYLSTPLAAGTTRTFDVSITLPPDAPNTLQGAQAEFDIRVDAVQLRNTTPPATDAFMPDS